MAVSARDLTDTLTDHQRRFELTKNPLHAWKALSAVCALSGGRDRRKRVVLPDWLIDYLEIVTTQMDGLVAAELSGKHVKTTAVVGALGLARRGGSYFAALARDFHDMADARRLAEAKKFDRAWLTRLRAEHPAEGEALDELAKPARQVRGEMVARTDDDSKAGKSLAKGRALWGKPAKVRR